MPSVESKGECSKGDVCSFRHDDSKRGESNTIVLSCSSQIQNDARSSSKGRSPRGRSPSGKRCKKTRGDITLEENVRIRRVSIGILPYVKILNWIGLQIRYLKIMVCVFQDVQPPKSNSILRKATQFLGPKRSVHFSKGTSRHMTIRERKGPSRKELLSILNFMSVAPILQNLRTGLKKRLWNKSDAPAETAQRKGRSHILLAFGCLVSTSAILHETRGKRICGGLRSINAHAEQERSELSWIGTVLVSTNPTTVITANGEVRTIEEATVYVNDLDVCVTVQILDHGYSYEWASGQKPKLVKNGRIIQCNAENYVPIVVPGLSTGSSSSSASTTPMQDTTEDSSSSPATTHRRSTREASHEILQTLGSTVSLFNSRKTPFAKCARETRLQGFLARSALVKQYFEQTTLMNWQQRITKFSVKVVNLETIVDMQSWCRTWPPNGSSHTVQNKNFSGDGKVFTKVSRSVTKAKSHFSDNSLEFGKACEELSLNHCTSTPHPETKGIAERAVRRINEGTSAVLLQSGLDAKWLADSMECYCYLRDVRDLQSDGKTPYERRFGEPCKGPVIPWFNDGISSCFCERPVKTPSIW